MKSILNTIVCGVTFLLLMVMVTSVGCSKKVKVDTVNLEYSFQTADETNQTAVTQAIDAIDKAEYSTARENLTKVAADPKLTAEQKTAVSNVLQQLP